MLWSKLEKCLHGSECFTLFFCGQVSFRGHYQGGLIYIKEVLCKSGGIPSLFRGDGVRPFENDPQGLMTPGEKAQTGRSHRMSIPYRAITSALVCPAFIAAPMILRRGDYRSVVT
jgi:hypothetical protein